MSGYLRIVQAAKLRNKAKNPSGEVESDYAAYGVVTTATTVTAGDSLGGGETAQARYGRRAFRLNTATANTGLRWAVEAGTNTPHTVALYVKPVGGSSLPAAIGLGLAVGTGGPTATATASRETDGTGWTRLYATFSGAQANGALYVYLYTPSSVTLNVLADGLLFYADSALHTYFDGDTPGCRWVGRYHASASLRPEYVEQRRLVGQGQIVDLDSGTDGPVRVRLAQGLGIAPPRYTTTESVGRPGQIVLDGDLDPRAIAVTLYLEADTPADLYNLRADIDRKMQVGDEFELWLTPETGQVYAIAARYVGGMDGGEFAGYVDQAVTLQLEAADPRWCSLAPVATALALSKSVASTYVAYQLDGEWLGGLALAAAPNVIVPAPNGVVWIGTRAAGGTAYLYSWDGYTLTQAATFTGGSGAGPAVNDLVITSDRYIVVTGDFGAVNGAGSFGHIAVASIDDTSAWYVFVGALSAPGYSLAISPDERYVYVGFGGTTAGGVSVNYITRVDRVGSVFQALGAGANGAVRAVRVLPGRGDVIVGGDFTQVSVPGAVTPTVTATAGGSLTGSVRRFIVTPMSGSGEQAASVGVSVLGSPLGGGGGYFWRLTWAADPSATGYRVYATTVVGADPGANADHYLLAETTAVTYDDYGNTPLSATLVPFDFNGYVNRAGARSARIARYNPVDGGWYSVGGSGMNGAVRALEVSAEGVVAVGDFTLVDGQTMNRAAQWRGGVWTPLGRGLSGGGVTAVARRPDGSILVGGAHTAADGYSDGAKLARFIGGDSAGQWVPADIDLSGSTVTALAVTRAGDTWVGHTQNTTLTAAGLTTVDPGGSWDAAPLITLTGPLDVGALSLDTTGAEILLRLSLKTNETLTIAPDERAVTSSMRGDVFHALLLGTQMSRFSLKPTANVVRLLARNAGTGAAAQLVTTPRHLAAEGT